MKIALSRISESGDNHDIEEFMKKVDDDLGLMDGPPSYLSSTFWQVLKTTKAIMDQFSQAVHILSLNLTIGNWLIKVIRYTQYSMHHGPLFPVSTR